MRVVEEINQALHALMEADSGVHFLGEDVLDPYGGAFKVSKGLSTRFPERVLTTPISEAAIVGFATGLAMRGKPAIVEIMFGDFLSLTMDQLLNHASKARWMFNDSVEVPLVVRTPMGAGRGYGPTHSQSIEKHFCGMPGLAVFAVSQFTSPAALLRRACELRAPTLLIENKIMYAKLVEPERLVRHAKPDAVILTYGAVAEFCVRAAERLAAEDEITVEVHVIERLSPFDADTVCRAAGRAANVLAVEEGAEGWGFAAECAHAILGAGLGHVTFASVAAPAHPIPSSRDWELAALPSEKRVRDAVCGLLGL
jgi:acetoin:2,6-dichlorophenolindophenol oxidoreductase subunit beta